MKILFVASEAVPFIKTGGLADVVGSLPKELRKKGTDVRVIMPKYGAIPQEIQKQMTFKKSSTVSLGWRNQYCGLFTLELEGIPFYFIDNEYYFKRDRIYGYLDDFDEAERFTFFSKAVLELLPLMDFQPDILHLHDWQTGMISLLLEAEYKLTSDYYSSIKTVLTIHNLKYQGIFLKDVFDDLLGLDHQYFTKEGMEYYGKVNFLKAGIYYSNLLTTVSQTYANEIQYPYFGEGLDPILRKRGNDLFGIVNGIDTQSYNPSTDPYISSNYSISTLEKKEENKRELQQQLNLPINKDIPIIAVVSRLVEQKGIDLIIHVLEEILQEQMQLIILGTGDEKYERILSEVAARYPERFSLQLRFDEKLSRQIYAGADLLLMPSKYEPCGISQLIAMRYLTIPIVRETGGLNDTVKSFNEYNGEGNGFSFSNYNAHDMLHTIRRAIDSYHKKDVWRAIMQTNSQINVGWGKSAEEYITLYQRLLQT